MDKKQRLTRENQGSGKEDREKEKMRLRGQSLLFVSTRLGDKENGPEIGGNYSGGGARGGDGNYNCRNPRFDDGEKLRKRLG